MTAFIEEPLNTNDASFWDPISKRKIKTYCSMTKKAKVKDRYSQCRLGLIVASTCQINPMEVMTYEFSPILCALAHQDGDSGTSLEHRIHYGWNGRCTDDEVWWCYYVVCKVLQHLFFAPVHPQV